MTDEEIDELISTMDNIHGKIFYSKFKSQREHRDKLILPGVRKHIVLQRYGA